MSSFISSFRAPAARWKRVVRHGGFLLLWAAAFALGVHFLNYLYVESSDTEWGRILWHHYYTRERNIDCLYLGSSHVYCDINPFMMDELNGKNNFNLASGSQQLNGSYYLLREADRQNELEHVYLEMYYYLSTGTVGIYSGNVLNNQRNMDYMRPSLNKLQYMLAASDPRQYAETFFPFVRYRSKLFDYWYVRDMVRHKETEDYRNYVMNLTDENGTVCYPGKGYYDTTRRLTESALRWTSSCYRMEEEPLTEDAEKYLREIIEYCRKKQIGITLFSSPVYELQILSTEHYDRYAEQIERIASEYGIEYYDFNLCREEYLPIQQTENFMDIGHLNATGASLYTPVFWRIVSHTAQENEAYFYPSYAEKLRETPPQIYGIYLADEKAAGSIAGAAAAAECAAAVMGSAADDGDVEEAGRDFGVAVYRVASNRPQELEYSIKLPSQYRDFSADPYFAVPRDMHGTCTVTARIRGQESVLQTLKIEY